MIFRHLTFFNWRKFKEADFILPKNSFYLLDENGAGKTTILSGIYSLLTGLPFPGTKFKDAIKTGENYFGLKSENGFVSGVLTGRLNIKKEGDFLNPIQVHTYIPTDNLWLFLPRGEQLEIWDRMLIQVYGGKYEKPLKTLENAVKNKNILLKNEHVDKNLYLNYTRLIHENSVKIWALRDSFFENLTKILPSFNMWINLKKNVVLETLKSNFSGIRTRSFNPNVEEEFLDPFWEKLMQKEKIVGRSLYGAQRDETNFLINDLPISTQFSRGEMRAFIVFLKKYVRDSFDRAVIWLLDDIFNEFDQEREHIILKSLFNESDFLIATGTKEIPKNLLPAYKIEDILKKS